MPLQRPSELVPNIFREGWGQKSISFVHFTNNNLNLKENSSLYDPKPIGQKLYIKVTGLNRIVGLKSQIIKNMLFFLYLLKTISTNSVFK